MKYTYFMFFMCCVLSSVTAYLLFENNDLKEENSFLTEKNKSVGDLVQEAQEQLKAAEINQAKLSVLCR